MACPMEEVRATAAWVASHSSHVTVDLSGPPLSHCPDLCFCLCVRAHICYEYCLWIIIIIMVQAFRFVLLSAMLCFLGNVVGFFEWEYAFAGIEKLAEKIYDSIPKVEWNFEGIHYFDNGPLTVQYLFVLDALNFCFWPGNLLCFR